MTGWLATAEGAEPAQTGLVECFNHPPQPVAAVFALVDPLCRPIPLTLLSGAYVAWVLLTAGRARARLEIVRALVVVLVLAELMAEVMKHLADQLRRWAVIDHLDRRGCPVQPHGNAYPLAHTVLLVAAVCGLWPWVRWPRRVVGTAVAILVACNRIYDGAHWPVDVVGGLAIGMFAGAAAWLVATLWSLYSRTVRLV